MVTNGVPGSRAPAEAGPRASRLGYDEIDRDELGDLHGIQRCTLAEVVITDEEGEAATICYAFVLADATDEAGVLAGRLQRGGDVGQFDARGGFQ